LRGELLEGKLHEQFLWGGAGNGQTLNRRHRASPSPDSMYRALMRNVRTCRYDVKGERQMSGPHKAERTNVWHTGGVTRISVDAS
jgi:hypothetical protein